VSIAVPAEAGIGLVAVDAQAVLHLDRRICIGAETNRWRSFLAPAYPTRVVSRRSVAGLTLQLSVAKRPVRI
jgi:hypothetical protein